SLEQRHRLALDHRHRGGHGLNLERLCQARVRCHVDAGQDELAALLGDQRLQRAVQLDALPFPDLPEEHQDRHLVRLLDDVVEVLLGDVGDQTLGSGRVRRRGRRGGKGGQVHGAVQVDRRRGLLTHALDPSSQSGSQAHRSVSRGHSRETPVSTRSAPSTVTCPSSASSPGTYIATMVRKEATSESSRYSRLPSSESSASMCGDGTVISEPEMVLVNFCRVRISPSTTYPPSSVASAITGASVGWVRWANVPEIGRAHV